MADAAEGRQPPDEGEGPFHGLLNWLRQLRGGREGEQTLREELEELIEEHADETPIDPHERRLLVTFAISTFVSIIGDSTVEGKRCARSSVKCHDAGLTES